MDAASGDRKTGECHRRDSAGRGRVRELGRDVGDRPLPLVGEAASARELGQHAGDLVHNRSDVFIDLLIGKTNRAYPVETDSHYK
jgi:hypothetical protein